MRKLCPDLPKIFGTPMSEQEVAESIRRSRAPDLGRKGGYPVVVCDECEAEMEICVTKDEVKYFCMGRNRPPGAQQDRMCEALFTAPKCFATFPVTPGYVGCSRPAGPKCGQTDVCRAYSGQGKRPK